MINQTRQKISKKNEKLLDRPLFFGEALMYAKKYYCVQKEKKTKNEHCNITIQLLLLSSNSKKEKMLLLILLQTQHRSKMKKAEEKNNSVIKILC